MIGASAASGAAGVRRAGPGEAGTDFGSVGGPATHRRMRYRHGWEGWFRGIASTADPPRHAIRSRTAQPDVIACQVTRNPLRPKQTEHHSSIRRPAREMRGGSTVQPRAAIEN
ncbi:hypothetical protein [Nocardia otitidiscaviarum]|uniref:hypothetical protein n=1 Tax=Nocardia otitidiscaviarum TaxID=1823 RepID=UPI00030E1E90|nr:hypothetical protein [Nocardia otitidiscaviarum]